MARFRETATPCGTRQFIDGRRVSNHDFSVAWLAALDAGRISWQPAARFTLPGGRTVATWEG